MTTNARDEKWSEWIDWNGGECPLPKGATYTVKFQSNILGSVEDRPEELDWHHDGSGADIIAYRYKIKEPEADMPEDLEWLARNAIEFPDYQEFVWIDGDGEVRFSDSISDDFYPSPLPPQCARSKGRRSHEQLLQARRDLGLVTTEAEDEAFMSITDSKEEADMLNDMVERPPHYQSDNGIECIDAIRAALGKDGFIAYCRGNAIKYQWRIKSNPAEDQGKSAWYANKAREALEE